MVSSWIPQMYSIHFTNPLANSKWSFIFCPLPRVLCSCVSLVSWTALFKSIYRRMLLEQYFSFRDLVIRSKGLLQVCFQVNDNSLFKTFFQTSIYMIAYDYCTFTWMQWCSFLYMFFVTFLREKQTNQTNKKTNKQTNK